MTVVRKAKPAAPKKPATAKNKPAMVFDIAKPGKGAAAASATSKPVLITNRPVMKDPMVNQDEEQRQTAPVVTTLPPAHKVVIKPIHEDLNEVEAAEPVTVQTAPAEAAPEAEATTISVRVAQPAPERTQPEQKPADEPESDAMQPPETPAANVEETTDEIAPAADDTTDAVPDAPSLEQGARIEELVEAETYFLPINARQQRRTKHVIVFGGLLIIVLALAWYNVALDANLLPNTYNLPHSRFFSVQ